MSDFRSRPKDQYIHEADWQQLYVLTEHWKSDLSFYEGDLKFLHHLIDKYFMWISKKEHIDMVREIEMNHYGLKVHSFGLATQSRPRGHFSMTVSYTHLRAHETVLDLVCRLLLEKKKKT